MLDYWLQSRRRHHGGKIVLKAARTQKLARALGGGLKPYPTFNWTLAKKKEVEVVLKLSALGLRLFSYGRADARI